MTAHPSENAAADRVIEALQGEALRLRGQASPARARATAGEGWLTISWPSGEPVSARFSTRTAYDVAEILQFRDHEFIRMAYLAALGREPDEDGAASLLAHLRNGDMTKMDVLQTLSLSEEGQRKNASITGLAPTGAQRWWMSIPLAGRVLRRLALILELPGAMREQRRQHAAIEALEMRQSHLERLIRDQDRS